MDSGADPAEHRIAHADDLLALLDRVGAAIASIGGGEVRKRARHDLEILGLFDRCRSLLGAVRVLLRSGFAQEAMVLARPLLTDSLALAELAAADDKRRAELAVGWELSSLTHLEGVMIEGEGLGEAAPEARAALGVRRAQIEAYARERELSTRHWQPDDQAKALAAKHGRRDEYLDLRILDHFTHGSTFATGQRYDVGEDEVVLVGGRAADQGSWRRGVVVSTGQSALHAARAMCRILGSVEPDEIPALLAEIEVVAADAASE